MRPLGVARRGDVVFLRGWTADDGDLGALDGLLRDTGVRLVFLAPGIEPVDLAPRRRPRGRREATPRWCRR